MIVSFAKMMHITESVPHLNQWFQSVNSIDRLIIRMSSGWYDVIGEGRDAFVASSWHHLAVAALLLFCSVNWTLPMCRSGDVHSNDLLMVLTD